MATRFYFSGRNTPTDNVTPAFAAWDLTNVAVRRLMDPIKDGTNGFNASVFNDGSGTADQTSLRVQSISRPMAANIVFNTGHTVKGVIQCSETNDDDNINRQPICLKIVSRDGATLRATLLPLANYGPSTTEWSINTLQNRRLADGDALQANYTTVEGDRLVLEIGGQVSGAGGVTVNGSMFLAPDEASDLAENDTDTSPGNTWFELSNDITFLVPKDTEGFQILVTQGPQTMGAAW